MKRTFISDVKELSGLATPMIISQLISLISNTLIGMLMIARLGHDALAAGALISTIFAALFCACLGLLFSVGIMVGKSHGAKNISLVCDFVQNGFFLATALSVPLIIILWNIAPILHLFGQSEPIILLVKNYMRVALFAILPILWIANFNQFTVGISKPKFILIWALISLFLNTVLGYFFIFGIYVFPKLGVSGFALATVVSSWFVCCVIFVIFKFHQAYQPYCEIFSKLRISKGCLQLLIKIGWPISVQFGGELGIFAAIAVLMGVLGTAALASQQIVQQTVTFVTIIPFCLSQATAILIGQASGRNDFDAVRRVGLSAISLSTIFTVFVGLLYVFSPKLIMGLFLNTKELQNYDIVALATTLFSIAAIYQVFDGIRNVITGALRGVHDTKKPMQISLFVLWFMAIPAGALLAFEFGAGPSGVLFGLVFGVVLLTIILGKRLYNYDAGMVETFSEMQLQKAPALRTKN